MKNLLATTALVVGIGFSAQASDPNATLDQIAEIVAAHYVEANAALEAENAALEVENQELLDSWPTIETYETEIADLTAHIADLNWLAEEWERQAEAIIANDQMIIADLHNQIEVLEALRNYYELTALENAEVIAVQQDQIADLQDLESETAYQLYTTQQQLDNTEAQLAEIWDEINRYLDANDITYDSSQGPIDAIWYAGHVTAEEILSPIIADLQAQLDDLSEVEALEAQLAAAQAETQEASNRANVNAQNATAWYEEAQRLQALLDEQD